MLVLHKLSRYTNKIVLKTKIKTKTKKEIYTFMFINNLESSYYENLCKSSLAIKIMNISCYLCISHINKNLKCYEICINEYSFEIYDYGNKDEIYITLYNYPLEYFYNKPASYIHNIPITDCYYDSIQTAFKVIKTYLARFRC